MDKQQLKNDRREEVMELNMAITGLEKLAERYMDKESFSFLSNLLALTERLNEKRSALIELDSK